MWRAVFPALLAAASCLPRAAASISPSKLRTVSLLGLRGWQDADTVEYHIKPAYGRHAREGLPVNEWRQVVRRNQVGSLREFDVAREEDVVEMRAVVGGDSFTGALQIPRNDLAGKGALAFAHLLELRPSDAVAPPSSGQGEKQASGEGSAHLRLIVVVAPLSHREVTYALWDGVDVAAGRGLTEEQVIEKVPLLWRRAVKAHAGHGVSILADNLPAGDGFLELGYEVDGKTARSSAKNFDSGVLSAGWSIPTAPGVLHYKIGGTAGSVQIPRAGFYEARPDASGPDGPRVMFAVHQSPRVMRRFWQAVHFEDARERYWNDRRNAWNSDGLAMLWHELHPSGGEPSSEEFQSDELLSVFDDAGEPSTTAESGFGLDFEDPKVWAGIPAAVCIIGLLLCYAFRPQRQPRSSALTDSTAASEMTWPPAPTRGLPHAGTVPGWAEQSACQQSVSREQLAAEEAGQLDPPQEADEETSCANAGQEGQTASGLAAVECDAPAVRVAGQSVTVPALQEEGGHVDAPVPGDAELAGRTEAVGAVLSTEPSVLPDRPTASTAADEGSAPGASATLGSPSGAPDELEDLEAPSPPASLPASPSALDQAWSMVEQYTPVSLAKSIKSWRSAAEEQEQSA